MYRYRACGLEIDSDILASHLPAGNPRLPPDARLQSGADLAAFAAVVSTYQWRLGAGGVHLLSDSGDCICSGGSRIAFVGDVPELDDTCGVLRRALGVLCYQRGLFVLHAVVVEKDGRAVALAGRSGVGKSTLAAELFHHGYRLLADDIGVCELTGETIVHPLYPSTRRKTSAPSSPRWRALPGTSKQVSADVPFCGESRLLEHLVVLEVDPAGTGIRFEELTRTHAVPFIDAHAYRRRLARAMRGRSWQLQSAAAIARNRRTWRVNRTDACSPAVLAEALIERIERR